MDYRKAQQLKNKSLISLIAKKKFQEGQGLGSSIKGAISDKFKARATRFKQKFDPLYWLSSMVGKGVIGKSITTVAGRAFGRSEQDIGYFGGYSRGKKYKKDPRRTTFGAGPIKALRIGDSSADILGKTYNFVQKTYEEEKRRYETEKVFREEQMEEDERRHKKLIEQIIKSQAKPKLGPIQKEEEEKEPSWIDDMLSSMKSLLQGLIAKLGLGSLFTNVDKILTFIDKLGKNLGKIIGGYLIRWLGVSGIRMILGAALPLILASAAVAAAYYAGLNLDKIKRFFGMTRGIGVGNEDSVKALNNPQKNPENVDKNYTEEAAKSIKEGTSKVYSGVPIIGSGGRKSDMVFSNDEAKELIDYHNSLSTLYAKIAEMKKGSYSDDEYKRIQDGIDKLELRVAKIQQKALERISKTNPKMETGGFGGYDYNTAKEHVSDTITRLGKGQMDKSFTDRLMEEGQKFIKDLDKMTDNLFEKYNPIQDLIKESGLEKSESTVVIQGQNNIGTGMPKTYNNDPILARINHPSIRKTQMGQIVPV